MRGIGRLRRVARLSKSLAGSPGTPGLPTLTSVNTGAGTYTASVAMPAGTSTVLFQVATTEDFAGVDDGTFVSSSVANPATVDRTGWDSHTAEYIRAGGSADGFKPAWGPPRALPIS